MATLNVKNFPDELYERLKERAERRRRSMAQEVTWIVEKALEEAELLSILDLEGLGSDVFAGQDAKEHVENERRAWG